MREDEAKVFDEPVKGRFDSNHEEILNYISQNNKSILKLIQAGDEASMKFIGDRISELYKLIGGKDAEAPAATGGETADAGPDGYMRDIEKTAELQKAESLESLEKGLESVHEEIKGDDKQVIESAGAADENIYNIDLEIRKYVSEFIIKYIETNNKSLIQIIVDNSASLSRMIGEVRLELHREFDVREQRLLELMVRRKSGTPHLPEVTKRPAPELVNPLGLEDAMARLRELAPLNYDAYLACLDTGTESYTDLPEVSCSTERHPQAMLFHDFLQPYLRDVVLDVGCGPQPVPSYLSHWPVENIVGIDPISSPQDHPFLFVPGIGEFLPFPDNSFGTVVSGTTLDHYYLLDLGLKEAFRVLEPGGYFVAWITEFDGAPEYDPYTAAMQPYDHEHMYHIDRRWFLPMMQAIGFEIGEIIHFALPFNYLFMSFRKPL